MDAAQLNALIQNLATLTAALSQRSGGASKAIAAPVAFKGDKNDARRFLTQFEVWADLQPGFTDATGARVLRTWFPAALSRLEGEAARWGTPYMARLNSATLPWATWEDFKKALRQRFQAADPAANALEQLVALRQGSTTVSEYAGRFQELATETALSDADKCVRFRSGLSKRILQMLAGVMIANKLDTLDKYIEAALHVDAVLRQTDHEVRAAGGTSAPARSHAPDPYAMDIDASRAPNNGKTRNDYMRAMSGRCFKCGATGHVRSTCPLPNARCNYCGRQNHVEGVCEDRFLGRARGGGNRTRNSQRVAATVSHAPASIFEEDQSSPATIATTTAATSPTTVALPAEALATLAQIQEQLALQNRVMNEGF